MHVNIEYEVQATLMPLRGAMSNLYIYHFTAVPHEGGEPQNKACKGGLLSSEFRTAGYKKEYIYMYVYDGTLGVIQTVGKGSEVPPGEEVDHVIELGIVSDAFCEAFKQHTLHVCLKVRSCSCNFFLSDSIPYRSCVKLNQF